LRARVAGHSNPTGKVYRAIFEDRLVVVKVPQVDDLEAQLEEYNLLARIVRYFNTFSSSPDHPRIFERIYNSCCHMHRPIVLIAMPPRST
jgi:hypothetical protein